MSISLNKGINDGVFTAFTIGDVVDVNDPTQMGRIRVRCAAYGDQPDTALSDLPWCLPVMPFGGSVQTPNMSRGTTDGRGVSGPQAYGFFSIPKKGATAVVTCIDGDPDMRCWFGCIPHEQTLHTMPHGRFVKQTLSNEASPILGPLNSFENKIPTFSQSPHYYDNNKYEWYTRVLDNAVSGLSEQWKVRNSFVSDRADDEDVKWKGTGWTIPAYVHRQGYQKSRMDAGAEGFEPQTYCWTTPGFHSISMDDSLGFNRMRFRTTTGHQIILDDTNERIHISTNTGSAWVEMDSDGSIDVSSTTNISLHATEMINLTAGEIRMHAASGIHMYSGNTINMQSVKTTHILTGHELRISTSKSMSVKSNDAIAFQSTKSTSFLSSTDLTLTATSGTAISGGAIVLGNRVSVGGTLGVSGVATAASFTPGTTSVTSRTAPAVTGVVDAAKWTNRVVKGVLDPRVSTENNFTHDPKYEYHDDKIGKEYKTRNPYWKR